MNVILKDGQKDCIDPSIIQKYCLDERKVTPFSRLKIEEETDNQKAFEDMCDDVTDGIPNIFREEEEDVQQSEWDL